LSVVNYMADRIAVMHLGKIIETATREQLFHAPNHPYTRALLSAVPSDNPYRRSLKGRIVLKGDPPSPANPPSGCTFHVRCPHVQSRCRSEAPALVVREHCDHEVACFYPQTEALQSLR
jgi:oligopeptide/dipeptide ABC transporter ATP-binding protein